MLRMSVIHNSYRNSRKEGNFIKRMSEENRIDYITRTIASYNARLLLPFIKLKKYDRYWREIKYQINNDIDPIYKGVSYNSRRESDYLMRLSHTERVTHTKEFIATCNAQYLKPFIKITGHDENFREIHYSVDIPHNQNEK